jgi:hypothetical protein
MRKTERVDELLTRFDLEQRQNLIDPRYQREAERGVVRLVPRKPGRFGFVIYSRLSEEQVDRAIQRQIERFSELGVDFEWQLFEHDSPPNLREHLAAHGLEASEAETILVYDLEQGAEQLLRPSQPLGAPIEIQRITEARALIDVLAVEEAVWGEKMGWLLDDLGGLLQEHSQYVSVYAAYQAGAPAAAAWTFYAPGSQFASLYGGATLEVQRGKGLYSVLVAIRAKEALQRGRRFLTVDAGEMSRPILERRGFRVLDVSYPYTWKATKEIAAESA